MSYFSKLPKLYYSTSLGVKNFRLVPDITAKVKFLDEVFENSSLYYAYAVKDGESPEDIAFKLYGDPLKHWVILLANKINDPLYDWVLESKAFANYIDRKYSSYTASFYDSDIFSTNYAVGEMVYQGSSFSSASTIGTVVDYNTTTRKVTINFLNDILANSQPLIGRTSNTTHTVIDVKINNDGYNWASNTTSHYKVTEISYNSYDMIKTTNSYKVSAQDFIPASNTVINRNTNTSYTNSYLMTDGTTLTVETTVAPVTYYDYESELNEAKRFIKVPKKEYVSRIVEQFNKLMSIK